MEYKLADKAVKKSCRNDKRTWIEDKGREAEEAAGKNDSKTLYRIVRELTGISSNSNVSLNSKQGKTLLTYTGTYHLPLNVLPHYPGIGWDRNALERHSSPVLFLKTGTAFWFFFTT